MDLLGALNSARQLRDFVRQAAAPSPPWANDEAEFERHFGVPYEFYAEMVEHLSPEQGELLRATVAVNPEAAVLWVLSMEQLES